MKYREMPRGWVSDDWWGDESISISVIETEKTPIKTGLLGPSGDPLYRVPEHHPIGFRVNCDD